MAYPSESPITIITADDHPLIRDGLAAVLRAESGLQVVAEAANGEEAIEGAGNARGNSLSGRRRARRVGSHCTGLRRWRPDQREHLSHRNGYDTRMPLDTA